MPADPSNEEDTSSDDDNEDEYNRTTCTPCIDPNETFSDKE
jgi:hypothetical protein